MNKFELIEALNNLKCGDAPIVIRGESVVAGISDVYIDHDHTDDSEFVAIDLEERI